MVNNMNKNNGFLCEYYSAVTACDVEWLWYPYIPYGKLTILQGDPGEGKSTFMLSIAALLTCGAPMPDGYRVDGPKNVIYQTAEDNIADTVKPRLIHAGADCKRVAYIVDSDVSLTLDDERIERALQETKARLFILDPLQAYLSQDSDMMMAGRMRQQLRKLSKVAERYNCAMVIIGHMNKSSAEKNLYRGLGSIDIAAIARSVLMIARDKTDPMIRYMFPVKTSLAPEGKPIAFSFGAEHGIEWIGQREISINTINRVVQDESKLEFAKRMVTEMLTDRDLYSSTIVKKMKVMGVSERTLSIAKKDLGITSYKKNGVWFWHMD